MRATQVLPVKTAGVMGDGRTYDFVVGLRAVTSTDGMTADFYQFDMRFLGETATRIINEVKGVNRVVYDVTSKIAEMKTKVAPQYRPLPIGRSSDNSTVWVALAHVTRLHGARAIPAFVVAATGLVAAA